MQKNNGIRRGLVELVVENLARSLIYVRMCSVSLGQLVVGNTERREHTRPEHKFKHNNNIIKIKINVFFWLRCLDKFAGY